MKRLLLSWVITLFIFLSPTLSQISQAQCPETTFVHNKKPNGFPDGGFELTYVSAKIPDPANPYYVRLTFKVINYYKSGGMDYLACQMPDGAGVVSSGVSIKSPLDRIYLVENGADVVNKNYPTFYGAKMVSVDEKSQFKSGANLVNNDTYTLDMSLYEFTTLSTLTVAVRAGGDGGGNGNEKYFPVPINVNISSCKTPLMANVANFTPKKINGPVMPMTGYIVQYTIPLDPERPQLTYKWGVPDVNDGLNNAPGWEILDGQGTNTITVKVGPASGSMRVEVKDPLLPSGANINARTMPVTVIPNPLPVELVKFEGAAREGGVQLNWSTATEIDNDKFEVERSTNGKDFDKVGEVKGAGNSSMLLMYTFTDANAPAGTVYYRLNQIDYDKDQEYSKVIAIKNAKAGKNHGLSIFPNPVTQGIATIKYSRGASTGASTLRILDMSGKILHSKDLDATANEVIMNLDQLGLRRGLYLISITTGQESQMTRILIQ